MKRKKKKNGHSGRPNNSQSVTHVAVPLQKRVTAAVPVTVIVLFALLMVSLQYFSTEPFPEPIPVLKKRVVKLSALHDPVERELQCLPLSSTCRQIDKELPKDCKVFLSGTLGRENCGSLGIYFFLVNYLFPRHIDISLDEKPCFNDVYATGKDATSAAELFAKGYGCWIKNTKNGCQFYLLNAEKK